MALACIDVGSNTTRLLVAELRDGRLHELCTQRAFTELGQALGDSAEIPAPKIEELADVVAGQADTARRLHVASPCVVGTAAIRSARNRSELRTPCSSAPGCG